MNAPVIAGVLAVVMLGLLALARASHRSRRRGILAFATPEPVFEPGADPALAPRPLTMTEPEPPSPPEPAPQPKPAPPPTPAPGSQLLSPDMPPPLVYIPPEPAPAPEPEPAPPAKVKPPEPEFPLNDIERALMAAASDAAARPAFSRAVLEAELWAVASAPVPPPDQRTGFKASLMTTDLEGGEVAVALFTARERAAWAFEDEGHPFAAKGAELFARVRAHKVYLNPGSPWRVLWGPKDIEAMLSLPQSRVLETDVEILLGAPAQTPEDLVARLKAAYASEPGIAAAWLALAHWSDTDKKGWYLDVRSSLPPEDVGALTRRALEGADTQGLSLDMVVKAPGGTPGVGIALVGP